MAISRDLVNAAAQLVRQSTHMVVFSGAGISTPSGIPDFRSAGSGLWQKDDPMEVASATAFRFRPKVFYDWLRPLMKAATAASPNPAHTALAVLEQAGIVKAVITQNIDGLHQRAGSSRVIELHGNMRVFYCPMCGAIAPDAKEIIEEIQSGSIPRCPKCGGVVRPDITLYEEALPMKAWQAAETEIRSCDLLLVAGSSLEVFPAASLPYDALEKGAKVMLINYSPTPLDRRADLVLNMDVSLALPQISELVGGI